MSSYITSAFAGALLLGLGTAALAATGEFDNMCTEGLALGKDVKTDCSVNTVIDGKTSGYGGAGTIRTSRAGTALGCRATTHGSSHRGPV